MLSVNDGLIVPPGYGLTTAVRCRYQYFIRIYFCMVSLCFILFTYKKTANLSITLFVVTGNVLWPGHSACSRGVDWVFIPSDEPSLLQSSAAVRVYVQFVVDANCETRQIQLCPTLYVSGTLYHCIFQSISQFEIFKVI